MSVHRFTFTRHALRYARNAALLGFCFPITATMVDVITRGLVLSASAIFEVQISQPLHWIVDTFPFVFAGFGFLTGKQQDISEEFRADLSKKVDERTSDLVETNRQLEIEMEERRQADEAILRAKNEWERTFDSVPDSIAIIGVDDCFVRVNNSMARRISLLPDECPGRPYSLYMYGLEEVPEYCPHAKTMQDGKRHSYTHYVEPMDSTFLLTSSPIVDEFGKLVGTVLVSNDITALKRAEGELRLAKDAAERANRSKSLFLANMSHELRTPLNAIIGYSEMLEEDAEDAGQDEFIADLKKIQSAGKHLLGLINEILDLSKIEAGKVEVVLEKIDIAQLIEGIASTVRPLVAKNENKLVVECGEDIGTIYSDVTKLRQCLFNFLSNASKFTEKAEIKIVVKRAVLSGHSQVTFSVSDEGIGMTPEQVARIFEPFSQADATTTRKYGGTGLGLAITQRFCEMLGGEISVRSEPGAGSTFAMVIPDTGEPERGADADSSVQEGEPSMANTGPATAPPPNRENTVLIIDDDPDSRDLLSRFVEKEGFSPFVAPDGETGIEMARRHHPRLVILDIMMPGFDGWSVLETLKMDPQLQDIPVVIVSILQEEDMGYALGAADYLTKPVDKNALARAIERFRIGEDACKILVVDDDPDARDLARRTLEKTGWIVVEAENGLKGLEAVREEEPSLILLDLMMPEMDGFEFLAEMDKNAEWSRIPVVVLTSKDLSKDELERLHRRTQSVMQKGAVKLTDVLAKIRELMGQVAANGSGGPRV